MPYPAEPTGTTTTSLFETVLCPVCGDPSYDVLKPAKYPAAITADELRSMYSASSDHSLLDQVAKCGKCSHVFLNPRPKREIFLGGYTEAVDPTFVAQNDARIATFRATLGRVLGRLGLDGRGKRLLDIGCAGGAFPVAARELGFDVTGVEPSRWMADYGRTTYGLDVRNGVLTDGMFPEQSFHTITLWDVIEHLPDPADTLRIVRKLLRPDGILLVNYPDIGSFAARALGDRWPFWLSVHLNYYTPESISRQLTQSGFAPQWSEPCWQTLPLGYVAKRAAPYVGPARGLLNLIDAVGLSNVDFTYNMGQTLVVSGVVAQVQDISESQVPAQAADQGTVTQGPVEPRVERRSQARVASDQSLKITVLSDDTTVEGRVTDMSGSGMRALIPQPVPAGTLLKIEAGDAMLLGEVVRCDRESGGSPDAGYSVGIRVQHSLAGLAALSEWTRAYREEASRETAREAVTAETVSR